MKTALCYFSGTGNTFYIAKRLKEALPESDLLFIPSIKKEQLKEYDRIGLIFPTYWFGPPVVVLDFIKKLEFNEDAKLFTVINSGGEPFLSAHILKAFLKKKHLTLNNAMYVTMPNNYMLLYSVNDEVNQRIMANAEVIITKIIDNLVNNHPIPIKPHLFGWLRPIIKLLGKLATRTDRHFIVTNCNGCMQCVRLCPMNNIVYKDKTIKFKHNCAGCLGCLNICPIQAINYKHRTVEKKRYFNSKINPFAIKTESHLSTKSQ